MKVVFDERAAADLEDIYRFIATDNPRNAQSVVDRIVASVERLGQFPEMARAGQVDGTREWVVPQLPFIVVYRLSRHSDEVVVTGIFHGARDRNPR